MSHAEVVQDLDAQCWARFREIVPDDLIGRVDEDVALRELVHAAINCGLARGLAYASAAYTDRCALCGEFSGNAPLCNTCARATSV